MLFEGKRGAKSEIFFKTVKVSLYQLFLVRKEDLYFFYKVKRFCEFLKLLKYLLFWNSHFEVLEIRNKMTNHMQ